MFICMVTNLGGWIANVLTKVGTFDLDMVVLAIIGIINVL